MDLNYEILHLLSEEYGNSFYILDLNRLISNYISLNNAFIKYYPNFKIAYSYKTNYTPAILRQIKKLDGYAEVVSEMEYELAKRIGVSPEKIIMNGPVKGYSSVRELLLSGGQVNIDSEVEFEMLKEICQAQFIRKLRIGIRCNFDVFDGNISRFGIDVNSPEFARALEFIRNNDALILSGLHCHFADRKIDIWKNKVSEMLSLIKKHDIKGIESVDLGGGLYGDMSESLKEQFLHPIPTYDNYAEEIAIPFYEFYKEDEDPPKLIIEPGTALCGDVMSFVTKVISIKSIRGKYIATLSGSAFNINAALNKKNLPITVYHKSSGNVRQYENLDFGGYTCIESDYLFRNYTGELCEGDFVVFDNAGSYSVVLKPPFILPNFPIISLNEDLNKTQLIKKAEMFDDVFRTYLFE